MSHIIRILLGILLFISLPSAALLSIGALIIEPAATGANFLLTVVHLTIVVFLLRISPVWPKSAHILWAPVCLAWGAIGSIGISLLVAMPTSELVLKLDLEDFVASFAGGYPEEVTKAIGVLLILFSFRCLNRPWHGLATGMLVGTGFDVHENFGYAANGALMDPTSDVIGVVSLWAIRTVFGPGLHLMFAGFTGFGIGLAFFTLGRSLLWRLSVATFWFLVAFITHFTWNYIVAQSITGTIITSVVAYSTLLYVIIRCWLRAKNGTGYLTVDLNDPKSFEPMPSSPQSALPPPPAQAQSQSQEALIEAPARSV